MWDPSGDCDAPRALTLSRVEAWHHSLPLINHITLQLDPLLDHFSLGPLSADSAPHAHCP